MRAKTTLSVSSCKQNIMGYYFMLDYMAQLSSITLGYANIMLTNCCMSFFQTDAEFWPTPPFDQKEKRLLEITSPCAGWMTDRVIKETEKRKKNAAWRNSVIAYWKVAGGEARCPWHAWNSISHCQTTQCHGLGDISKQFPVDGQSSCNTIQIWETALGKWSPLFGHHRNEVKRISSLFAAAKKPMKKVT